MLIRSLVVVLIAGTAADLASTAPAAAATGRTFAAWRQLFPPTPPAARLAPSMAVDHANDRVVLFGGFGGDRYLGDTWIWSGSGWQQAPTATTPPPRAAAGMAWDSRTKQLVMYGGFDGHYLGDTWTWESSSRTWKAWPRGASAPPVATAPMLFTDPLNGHVDLFGGFDGQFYQLEMWQWDGSAWHQLHPAHVPTARSAAVASEDPGRHEVVLYGGLGDVNPLNTWTWDGVDWTLQSPASQPDFVYDAASDFDPRLKEVVAFGGAAGGVPGNHTWAWTGSDWTRLTPRSNPLPRESEGMAFDPVTRQSVVFGGNLRDSLYGDTWGLALSG